ncbi:MAG: tyrosine-protein phosphatase [Clostridia bacterium]|nr:tyrosine-protein phosphatase [Clostridia bacterium]
MHVHVRKMQAKKLFNTRDLGGLPAADGKKIKHGKLLRSGKLSKLPKKTVDKLKRLGVTTVVDLRIFTEIEEHPDTLWEGVNYVHLPLLCTATPGITREKSMKHTMVVESKRIKSEFGTGENYMEQMYRSILLSEEPQQHLKTFLRLVIDNDGAILWHCSSGKDRAGIVAMLIESLLGVSEEVILADYTASSRFLRGKFLRNKLGLVIAPCSIRLKKLLKAFMDVKPQFLTTAMNAAKEQYGSIENYCKQVLGVTDQDIETLKSKYLE